jgi:hypothetical protein
MKVKINLFIPVYIVIASLVFLIGCSPNTATATITTETPLPTKTSEIRVESTPLNPTNTETSVPSSTPSLTPTITDTPTIAPSPTPNMVMPGNYYIGKCADLNPGLGAKEKFCINDIRVDEKRHMFFNVSWTASNVPNPPGYIIKPSDKNNYQIYLMDNLGNRYDQAAGGGAAHRGTNLENDLPHPGWFEFGSPPAGALNFDFHDANNHLVIKDIVLIPGYGYIQYDTLNLDQYPLIIKYDKDKWNPTKSADNTNMLTHKTMPSCTIKPNLSTEPKGTFKSQIAVGDIDYKIYAYFDNALDLYVREYVYDSGIERLDPNIKPFFIVTIPADKSLECIVATNNVLSRLALPTP